MKRFICVAGLLVPALCWAQAKKELTAPEEPETEIVDQAPQVEAAVKGAAATPVAPSAAAEKDDEASAAAGAPAPAKAVRPQIDVNKLPFTPDSIKTVVAYHQPEIQACYEGTLVGKKRPPEGMVVTSFTITPNGNVKNAKVQKKGTTLRDNKLHDCVVFTLTSMTFPKPPTGQNQPVEYPFNLKAQK